MRSVYLDHLSATRPHPQVVAAMLPYLGDPHFGNPFSRHQFGETPRRAVEEARGLVARLLSSSPEEIVFTASGSEANNLAIKGILSARKGRHLISSPVEHMSVLHPIRSLQDRGYSVTWLEVDRYGRVDPGALREALGPETALVSIGHGIGEVGTLQPLQELAMVAAEGGVPFHSDAMVTAGTVPIDVSRTPVSALTISAQPLHGPKGVGILYLREGIRLHPQVEGGMQEAGLRAGTENVPGIVGTGVAAQLAREERTERVHRLEALGRLLLKGLRETVPGVVPTGHPTGRVPGHVSICLEGVEGEAILNGLHRVGIAATTGSACASEALKDSYVLEAIGIDLRLRRSSLVFTFGIFNQPEDVNAVLEALPSIVERIRRISPFGTTDDPSGGPSPRNPGEPHS